jgi:hypothetical protein
MYHKYPYHDMSSKDIEGDIIWVINMIIGK